MTKLLEAVYKKDQEPRYQLDSIQQQYGYNSNPVNEQWELINSNDAENIRIVASILDKYGWLGEKQISKTANLTLFLVVQHADIEYQVRYIDLLKKAVEKSNAKPTQYAYLLDRVNMRQGKLQIYGSQRSVSTNGKSYFYPIKDVLNVNTLRKKIGLTPLTEVTLQPGLLYNMPAKKIAKNQVVITGFVIEKNQSPIDEVSIKFGAAIVATTNADGFYIAIIEKKTLKEQLTFSKPGYILSDPPLNDEGKEVYELTILLSKK
ncbi:DUF6624 domain-containing protein [Ferruginibacter sp. SUN106]|uniref:DUF6624 domain-containing protein n=1 Tax=Ferruginibacter sp. SUN106 TaxID=2978348 RepID=UPI003D35AE45